MAFEKDIANTFIFNKKTQVAQVTKHIKHSFI